MEVKLEGRLNAADIAKSLGPLWQERDDDGDNSLEVVLGNDCFLYPSAVAWLTTLLARWQADGGSIEFDGSNNRGVEAYLARMKFFEHLNITGEGCGTKRTVGGRFLPLLAIEDEDAVFDAVNAVLDLLMMHFDNARDILPAVEWALNEITDNIVIHSATPVPGFVFAQFYPKKNVLSVAIADAGRGLRDSLAEAHDVDSDRRALALAMQRGVTRGVGQGNGIAGTRQIVEVNGGGFAIWSGAAHHYRDDQNDLTRDIPTLPGTGISIRFDTSRPIDLRETFIESVDFTYIEAVAAQLESDGAVLQVASESSGFGGRSPALRVRRKLLAILPDMDEPLTLDFSGVDTVSSSYIDELLGKLIAEIGLEEYESTVRIANMAPSVARRANVTIGQRLAEMGLQQDSEPKGSAPAIARPSPELEFEGWLAIHPDRLQEPPTKAIEEFCFRWEIELNDELIEKMNETFEQARSEEHTTNTG